MEYSGESLCTEHPWVLVFLENYVRKPLEGTLADTALFTPCKQFYLDNLESSKKVYHRVSSKEC